MRARLAIAEAQIACELREVVLRDKPAEMLTASPKGTVPVLITHNGVIDESLDIMLWALRQNDPNGWLDVPDSGWTLIKTFDGPFKAALDHTKYASRHPEIDTSQERAKAVSLLTKLDEDIGTNPWIHGETIKISDMAIINFVRQFAMIDKAWFDTQPLPNVIRWLDGYLASTRFSSMMQKYPQWHPGDPITAFPG